MARMTLVALAFRAGFKGLRQARRLGSAWPAGYCASERIDTLRRHCGDGTSLARWPKVSLVRN